MKDFIKNYWDIISGFTGALTITIASSFDLTIIQLSYSIIILMLVLIGVFKIIKQSVDKNKGKRQQRKQTVIDNIVDGQKGSKAISLAQEPTKEGEKLGKLIIIILKGTKRKMKKIKEFFSKFKGYILAFALAALSIIEMCGGYINTAFGDKLIVNGVELLPIITLVLSVIVGCISNGFSKEQAEKVKALFSKKPANELVIAEIKKTIKEDELKLKEFNKILITQETELDNLESHLVSARNTHEAKKEMYAMTPRLATMEDVQLAANEVVTMAAQINDKKRDIENTKTSINNLTTTIGALKSQL